jgi:pyrroline-5-carboxylate reductase
MHEKYGTKTSLRNVDLLEELRIIVLAVKPQVMDDVLKEIAPFVTEHHLVISVAAGYTISRMTKFLGEDKRLIRIMPNTPSKIGAGAAGFCLG